jgi:hypothetical protein
MKRTFLALLAVTTAGLACSSSPTNNNPGGGTNTLTVSAATPANGNGSLTNITVTADPNGAVAQGPAVYLKVDGDVSGLLHHFEIYVLKSDNSLPNIEHTWGANLVTPDGFTLCDAGGVVGSPCATAQVSASITQKKVTFTGLALTAATGDGDLSTITGTVVW